MAEQAKDAGLIGEGLAGFKKFCEENEPYLQQDVVDAKIVYFKANQSNTESLCELDREPEADCEACQ